MNATGENTKPKPFMSCKELHAMLPNRTLRSIQNDCARGNLPAKKLGHSWLIARDKCLDQLGLS